VRAVADHSGDEIVICTVIIDEILSGWYTMLRKAKTTQAQAQVHASLAESFEVLSRFSVIPMTQSSLEAARVLFKTGLNIGNSDLKIAALALELDATVVTNNIRDFSRVPGLKVEDWSV
jgi:tRNA(fMet)-specific endonuclease VapC